MYMYKFTREDLQQLGLLSDPDAEPRLTGVQMCVVANETLEGVLGFHGYDQIEEVNLIELSANAEVCLKATGQGSAFIRTGEDGKWEAISQPASWCTSNQYTVTTFMIPLLPPYVTLKFTDEQYQQYLQGGSSLSVVTYHKLEEYPVPYTRLIPMFDQPAAAGFIPYTGNGFEFKILYGTIFGFVNHLGLVEGTLSRVTADGFEPVDINLDDYPVDVRNGVMNVIPDYSNRDGRRFTYERKDPAQYWMIKRKGIKPQYVVGVKPEPFETILIQAPIGAVILIREAYSQKALVVTKDSTFEVDPEIYLNDPRFELFPIPA